MPLPLVALANDCPANYRHPDAANFNAWRRHLHLADPNASEETVHKWEDVKGISYFYLKVKYKFML